MKVKRDQVTGLVLIILGIVFLVLISQFSKPLTAEYPGPKLMPGIAAVGLCICGLGVFIKGCRQKEEDAAVLPAGGLLRIIISFALLCLYIFGMKYLGYLICTPILLLVITTYFAKASKVETKWWQIVLYSLIVTAVIWGMYVALFDMELPIGLLFE